MSQKTNSLAFVEELAMTGEELNGQNTFKPNLKLIFDKEEKELQQIQSLKVSGQLLISF